MEDLGSWHGDGGEAILRRGGGIKRSGGGRGDLLLLPPAPTTHSIHFHSSTFIPRTTLNPIPATSLCLCVCVRAALTLQCRSHAGR